VFRKYEKILKVSWLIVVQFWKVIGKIIFTLVTENNLFLEIRKSEESSNYEMQQKYFCTVL
jgi:hypothetical protein